MEGVGAAVALAGIVATFGFLTQKIVERLRVMVPGLNGNWVSLVALLIGVGFAYAVNVDLAGLCIPQENGECIGIRDFPPVVDWIIVGGMIASGAGYIADRAGRSNATVLVTPAPTTVVMETPVIDP